ncbi:MAG: porin [Pseudomonadota bacterium]
MKKQLLVISVAAAIAAPAAMADVTAYGRIHVSGDMLSRTGKDTSAIVLGTETKTTLPDASGSRSNSLGLKGSIDSNIPDTKVVFQAEVGIDGNSSDTVANTPNTGGAGATAKAGVVWMRDTYGGLSNSALGTVRGGIMSHSYKETHATIDPLFTTALEGRGNLGLTSGKGNGYGADQGSMVGSVRYDSPSFAGVKVIAQVSKDLTAMNYVVGARYAAGPVALSVDHINDGSVNALATGMTTAGTATMFAAKLSMAGVGLAVAYEMDGGAISGTTEKTVGTVAKAATNNQFYGNVDYTMGNLMFVGSYGMKFDSEAATAGTKAKDGSSSWRVAAKYAVAKGSEIYAGYGARTANEVLKGYDIGTTAGKVSVKENTVFTVGLSTKF